MGSSFPSIAGLLRRCRPTAIVGRVRAVVVSAVKRVAFGARPHVGVKVRKHAPSFADVNTAPAVVLVGVGLWFLASLTHAEPDVVFSGVAHAMHGEALYGQCALQAPTATSRAVHDVINTNRELHTAGAFRPPITGGFVPQDCDAAKNSAAEVGGDVAASATASVAISEIHTTHDDRVAARASASPHCLLVAIIGSAVENGQLVEGSAGHINNRHTKLYTNWALQVGADRYLKDGG